jgi:cell division protein FtsI/penicillin-binding protein 2
LRTILSLKKLQSNGGKHACIENYNIMYKTGTAGIQSKYRGKEESLFQAEGTILERYRGVREHNLV